MNPGLCLDSGEFIGTFADDAINIARAIEAAHGIKEKL
jgi:hypothetical protein